MAESHHKFCEASRAAEEANRQNRVKGKPHFYEPDDFSSACNCGVEMMRDARERGETQ